MAIAVYVLTISSLLVAVPSPPAATQAGPTDVIIVLDLSGSMAGSRLDSAKSALSAVVGQVDPEGTRLGLRGFTNCGVSSSVVPLGPLDVGAFRSAVDGLSATGPNTDISTAMTAAANDLPPGGTVVLISDGAHNCGPPEPCDAARAIAARGLSIRVDTVSFQIADPAARAELECIARETGGTSIPVEDEDALRDAIGRGVQEPPPPQPGFVERSNANIGVPAVSTAADPVQVSSGNFTETVLDMSFGDSLYAMDLVRSYNSANVLPDATIDPVASVFGRGWRLRHQITAHAETDGQVAISFGSGRILRFTPDGSGGYDRPSSFFGKLAEDDGDYRIDYFNGERWVFTDDRVTEMISPDNGSVHIDYDAAGLLTAIRSSFGPEYRLHYNADSRVSKIDAVVDGTVDRSMSFGYDAEGDLAEVIDAVGNPMTYTTDADGRITSMTDASGVTSVEMTYDAEGRVATQLMPTGEVNEFSYEDDVTTLTATAVIDADGNTRTDAYRYEVNASGYTTGLTDPLGSEVDFELDVDGQATMTADRRANAAGDVTGSEITQDYDEFGNITTETIPGIGTYTYVYDYAATDPDGSEITLHRLATSTAPNGGVTTYSYNGTNTVPSKITGPAGLEITNEIVDGLVQSSADADGVTTVFTWDAFRRLHSVTDGEGNMTRMGYDHAGRLTRLIDASGAATVMTYDAEDRLLTVTDRTGAVTTREFDEAGRITAYADALDATPGIESRRELTYDDAGLMTAITDERGNTTTNDYNGFGQLTASTAPGGATWQFEFSELGRLNAVTEPVGDDRRLELNHDVEGLLGGVDDPEGASAGVEYDDADRPIRMTDRNGIVSTFTYDDTGGGQLLARRSAVGTADEVGVEYEYDEQYRITAITGPRPGQRSEYAYSPAGRVETVTDGNGNVVTFNYDSAGRVHSVAQPGDRVVRYHYDANGRVVALTTPEGLRYLTGYDLEGRINELVSPAGVVTRFTYNANGTTTSATLGGGCSAHGEPVVCPQVDFGSPRLMANPGGVKASKSVPITPIDGTYEITLRSFDSRHATLPQQDQPKEQWVLEGLDDHGKVVFVTEPSDDIPDQLPGNETVVGSYDLTGVAALRARHAHSLGEREWNSVTPAGVTFTGPGGQTRTFDIDSLVLNGATDPDGGNVEYGYDGRYNLTRWVDQNGNATTHQYNQSDEQTATTDPIGRTTTTTYDDLGRVETIADASGRSASATYDAGDRVTGTTYGDGSSQQFEYDHLNRVVAEIDLAADGSELGRVSYTYESGGNVASVTEADGDVIAYEYDAVGNRTKLVYPDGSSVTYRYDELNRMVSAVHSLHGETSYRYDDDSRLTEVTFPGGETRSYSYVGEQLRSFADGNRRWHLSYDGQGRIDEITGSDHWRFSYGHDGQVTEAVHGDRTWAYRYDAVGNLTSIDDSGSKGAATSTGFLHDAANQIVGTKAADGTATGAWSHDDAGRMTSSTLGDQQTAYDYDIRGRLETVTVAGPNGDDVWARSYGPDELLSTVTHTDPEGHTTTYELTWDRSMSPARPLGWSGDDDGADISLIHGVGPALAVNDGQVSRIEMGPLGDVVGSVVAVGDRYGPYGSTDADGFGLGYRGELHVGPTIDLKARDLHPELGRFLTPDPVAAAVGSSTTSGYAYAANDPINLVDPFGLSPSDRFARFIEEQISEFSLEDFLEGVAGYAWDQITGVVDLGKVGFALGECAHSQTKGIAFGLAGVAAYQLGYGGSCDKAQLLREGVEDLAGGIYTAVKDANVGALLDILSVFMPERCAFDIEVFELDYCAGQASAAIAVAVATGGSSATGNLARLGKIADLAPSRLDDAAGGAAKHFPDAEPPRPRGNNSGGCSSFDGSTLVVMGDGSMRPIADIRPGDDVMATDPRAGKSSVVTVAHVWVHVDWMLDLVVGSGDRVTTTEDHPFWNVGERQWQRADQLDRGDHLGAIGGGTVVVVGLDSSTSKVQHAFNLSVEEPHTYHVQVGEESVLVHNCGEAKLSDPNPVGRNVPGGRHIRAAYEDIVVGRGTPRIDPSTGRQTVHSGRGSAPNYRSNPRWKGALEWDVPGTSHRILERTLPDGRSQYGYVVDHNYNNIKTFPSPWYPDGGRP